MNLDPLIDIFFIKGNPSLKKVYCNKETNEVWTPCQENLIPGIFQKTIHSLDYFREQYDYIYRTNLSSFVNLPHLFEWAQKQDKKSYRGCIGIHKGVRFASGCGFLMGREATAALLKVVKEKPEFVIRTAKRLPDDVAIGKLLTSVGIPPRDAPRIRIRSIVKSIEGLPHDVFHARLKQDKDRSIEPKLFQNLIDRYYFK